MIRTFLAVLVLMPCAALAQQQPPAPSATAQFTGQIATLLSSTLDERDAARSQLAACQTAAAKPPQPPTPSPETPPQ
jgi:hypothetical protein